MFPYEFKEKRVESVTQTKWWLAAGLCGLFITTCFIAITLWLGMNNSANYTLPSYNFNKIPIPSTTKPPPPLPEIYPSAEILRTNIKSKKGRIEIVHEEKVVEATSPTSVNEELHESTEIEIEDYLEEPSVVSSSQSNYVHSSLPTSSSTVATSRNTFETTDSSLKQTPLADSLPDTQGDSSVTRKKSQALYPAWSEPDVPEQMDEYQFQPSRRVYDNAFETKTTPPFTYTTENRNRDIPVREHTLNRIRPLEDPYILNRDPILPNIAPLQADSFQNEMSVPRDPLMYRKDQLMPSREHDILHVSNDIKNENDLYYVTSKTPTSNPMLSFLQKRIQDIHDWLAVNGGDNKVKNADWLQVIQSINQSLTEKNATIILNKIKEMYMNSSELPMASLIYPTGNGSSPITTTPSLISFGLLAIDLFLLHNVQQIAWNEESSIKKEMLSDPDVIAMNALFMPPEKVILLRQANSRVLKDDPASENKGFLHEIVEFVNGGLRAAVNLGKAFRSSTTNGMGRSTSSSALDCIWTLYCRNLDKTARLQGPYGFLAKMNSLGLRLMMGEFPVEKAFEHLVKESSKGWKHLNCDTLFPR
ncbi:hypothetical protein M8J76_009482 [Diaphorina citri]|nr:hypothetical protein M8J76_009482 [Diaphorina citri]